MNKNPHFKCPWSYLCFSILAHKQHKLEARVNHMLVTTAGARAAARVIFSKIKDMSHVSCTLNVICFFDQLSVTRTELVGLYETCIFIYAQPFLDNESKKLILFL